MGSSATISAIVQLLRARMTTVSAVTYLAAALCGAQNSIKPVPFLLGHVFVLCCQFAAHALGDASDVKTDTLNTTATPVTGGSRALLQRDTPPALNPAQAQLIGYTFFALAFAILFGALPSTVHSVGVVIILLAHAYGAPPVMLNYRACGEIGAALITNVLLPMLAAGIQTAPRPLLPCFHPRMIALVIPSFLVKIAAFHILNMADRRPDWAAGKTTLAVVLGDKASASLVAFLMIASYFSAVVLLLSRAVQSPYSVLAMLTTAPYGWRRIASPLLRTCPYSKDDLLAPALFHSMFLVWAFTVPTYVANVIYANESLLSIATLYMLCLGYITVANVVQGRRRAAERAAAKKHADLKARQLRSSKVFDDSVHLSPGSSHCMASPDTRCGNSPSAERGSSNLDVVVVGAGVAGLTAAAVLQRLGLSVVVLEKKSRPNTANAHDSGADMALWPGAVTILRQLGVPDELFDRHCWPVDFVNMCNMDFSHSTSTVLKTIDMQNVTEGTGERFVLIARKRLMAALHSLVSEHVIQYNCVVEQVHERDDMNSVNVQYRDWNVGGDTKSVASRVVIGADGSRSAMKTYVVTKVGGDDSIHFCNEICYRGIIDFKQHTKTCSALQDLLPGETGQRRMQINYGAGLRSSFGYMSADRSIAYWWVKQLADKYPKCVGKISDCPWPEPLKSLHDLTPDSCFYEHAIEDSSVLPKWSSTRVVLVGDSAHTVTPNLGQGACLAVEDAFVLCTQLAKYWEEADGHLEAFYLYERARKPYASQVRSEARTQLKLGQLRHPVAVAAREMLLKSIPARVLEKKLRKHNFDLTPHLHDFRSCEGYAT